MKLVLISKNDDLLREKSKHSVLLEGGIDFISKESNTLNFVMQDKEVVIGGIDFRYALDSADILYFYVKKDKRRKGIGEKILKESIEYLKGIGIKEIFLEVNEENIPAINLYLKNGFLSVGLRKAYYDNKDAILMKKIIEE